MAYLIDTSVLGRLANTGDARHLVAAHSIVTLHGRGELLHITSQSLIEFRNMGTRPAAANGLGMTLAAVQAKTTDFEATFPLLVETADIFPAWKSLVDSLGVIGKQVHDARLVAVCHVHRVSHLLTFNIAHFLRFAGFGIGITVIDPTNV